MRLGPILLYRHDLGDYARRWILQCPLGTIRLHHLARSDADPDHPWSFASLLLWGSYREEVPNNPGPWDDNQSPTRHTRWRRWLSIRVVRATDRHRVEVREEGRGAWTLVVTGPKVRSWGFWRPIWTAGLDGTAGWRWRFTPWRQFVSQKENFSLDEYAAGLPPKEDA